MRLVSALALALLATLTLACGGHDHEAQYDNLEDCVIDHTVEEGLTEAQAITTCLLDHLDQLNLDFATVEECVAYVTDNGGYPNSRQEACEAYIAETTGG